MQKCKEFGFEDKSSMVRTALEHLRNEIENNGLKKSADLYAELYNQDQDLHNLTESATSGWPGREAMSYLVMKIIRPGKAGLPAKQHVGQARQKRTK